MFRFSKTEKEIIQVIASLGSPQAPYDLKSKISFSYTGVAKGCRSLEINGYLSSIESEGVTKGKRVEYSLTVKGVALSIVDKLGINFPSDKINVTEKEIESVVNIFKKNSGLSQCFLPWINLNKHARRISNQDSLIRKEFYVSFESLIKCCLNYSGIIAYNYNNQVNNDPSAQYKYLIKCPLFKIINMEFEQSTQPYYDFLEIYIQELIEFEEIHAQISEFIDNRIFELKANIKKYDLIKTMIEK